MEQTNLTQNSENNEDTRTVPLSSCPDNGIESMPSCSSNAYNVFVAREELPGEDETLNAVVVTNDEYLTEPVINLSPNFSVDIQNDSDNEITFTENGDFENDIETEAPKTEMSEKDKFKRQCREWYTMLTSIFTKDGTSLNAQGELLKFIKNIPQKIREKLPRDGRTLRPPPIKCKRRFVSPGEMTYFGIENNLNYAPDVLFDKESNEINLTCNMDGVPLTKTPSGKKFWPILGSVDEYPTFVIAAFEGRGQPLCGNDYIHDFVTEVKILTKNGCTVQGRVFKFRLRCLICDSPATCLWTKNHGGYSACRRCKTTGELFDYGKGITPVKVVKNKNEKIELKEKKVIVRRTTAIRYPEVNPEFRMHQEFVEYAQIT